MIWYPPGFQQNQLFYFTANYCKNDEKLRRFNQGKISANEIVSFDCALFQIIGISEDAISIPTEDIQYLAVIAEPAEACEKQLPPRNGFEWVGYDLIESGISAITDCGGDFDKAIPYAQLNKFGLLSSFEEAKQTQRLLLQEYPDEPHAECSIVAIWRFGIAPKD